MEKPLKQDKNSGDAKAAALVASTAIVGGFLLYWIVQIQAVREMLALAYGG